MNLRDHGGPCSHDGAYEVGPTLPFWLCELDECPGGALVPVKEEVDYVEMEVYAPGDTYEAIRGHQVHNIPASTKMRRLVSEWECVQ